MPVKTLKDFLDSHQVKYISITHSPAYTSQEVAASAHISGKIMAKVVVAKLDGKMAMVVVPANEHVNFGALKKATGVASADLASESEFKGRFPECEVGAMPPFGSLYDMLVYVTSDVAKHEHIIFNAGSHSELIQLSYQDFARLASPKIVAAE